MAFQQGGGEFEILVLNSFQNAQMVHTSLADALFAQAVEVGIFGHTPQMVLPADGLREKAVVRPRNNGFMEICIGIKPQVACEALQW